MQDTLIVIRDLSSVQGAYWGLVHRAGAGGGVDPKLGRGGMIHAAGSGNYNICKAHKHWPPDKSKRFLNTLQFSLSRHQYIVFLLAVFNKVRGRFICGPEVSVQIALHGPEERTCDALRSRTDVQQNFAFRCYLLLVLGHS